MVERPWGFVEMESVVSVHDLVKARGHQSAVARALESLNGILRVQAVREEALDRLAVVQQEWVAEAEGLVVVCWLVKAEGTRNEDTALKAVDSIVGEAADSSAGVAVALSAVGTAPIAEAVSAGESPGVAGRVAPTSMSQALATGGFVKAARVLPLLAFPRASELFQILVELG